jgi:hypothetical protein
MYDSSGCVRCMRRRVCTRAGAWVADHKVVDSDGKLGSHGRRWGLGAFGNEINTGE